MPVHEPSPCSASEPAQQSSAANAEKEATSMQAEAVAPGMPGLQDGAAAAQPQKPAGAEATQPAGLAPLQHPPSHWGHADLGSPLVAKPADQSDAGQELIPDQGRRWGSAFARVDVLGGRVAAGPPSEPAAAPPRLPLQQPSSPRGSLPDMPEAQPWQVPGLPPRPAAGSHSGRSGGLGPGEALRGVLRGMGIGRGMRGRAAMRARKGKPASLGGDPGALSIILLCVHHLRAVQGLCTERSLVSCMVGHGMHARQCPSGSLCLSLCGMRTSVHGACMHVQTGASWTVQWSSCARRPPQAGHLS